MKFKTGDKVVLTSKVCSILKSHSYFYMNDGDELLIEFQTGSKFPLGCYAVHLSNNRDLGDVVHESDLTTSEIYNSPLYQVLK